MSIQADKDLTVRSGTGQIKPRGDTAAHIILDMHFQVRVVFLERGDDFARLVLLAQLAAEGVTVHSRQVYLEDGEIDGVLCQERQRFLARFGFQDLIADIGQ